MAYDTTEPSLMQLTPPLVDFYMTLPQQQTPNPHKMKVTKGGTTAFSQRQGETLHSVHI